MVESRVEYAALCFRAALDGDAPKRLLPFLVGLLCDALESCALRLLPVEVLAGVSMLTKDTPMLTSTCSPSSQSKE